jgi:hypothetical protein
LRAFRDAAPVLKTKASSCHRPHTGIVCGPRSLEVVATQ